MQNFQLKTPVAFIIFKRPDTTEKVFEAIRQAKPPKLLVIADGPRAERSGEAEKCAATRAIIDRVDWECEVLKNYSDLNMGSGLRPYTGINWVFDNVDEAIILEDDCLPDLSFFQFCEELLEKYRNDERVMMICGTNVLGNWKSSTQSYHFSNYTTAWGWASWKRAWNYYDYKMKLWSEPEVKKRVRDVIGYDKLFKARQKAFDTVYKYNNEMDAWDFQWAFARYINSGLSIIPSVNLISNLGFSAEATHTKDNQDKRANLPLYSMTFPLKEPLCLARDIEYSYSAFKKVEEATFTKQIYWKLKKLKEILIQTK